MQARRERLRAVTKMGTNRRFTPEEDRYIRACVGRISGHDIARTLARCPTTIYQRARLLGLSTDPKLRDAKPKIKDGYRHIPLVRNGRRVWLLEHRHVMAQQIGRELESHEEPHHIDLDRANNSPDNLFFCETTGKHRTIHNMLRVELSRPEMVRKLMALGLLAFDREAGAYKLHGIDTLRVNK